MTNEPLNVLFLCTGNSARSIIAEALMNHATVGGGRFRAFSAGSHPKGDVNPFAIEMLERQRFSTAGLRSKSWDEFGRSDAPVMDFVITVCDDAAGETCPVWPGQPITAHWGVPDPAAVAGNDATLRHAFLDTFLILKRRIDLLTNLPVDKLRRLELQRRVSQIGQEHSPAHAG